MKNDINVVIPANIQKELPLWCLLKVQFVFNGETCKRIDGTVVSLPLGSIVGNTLVSKLGNYTLAQWVRTSHVLPLCRLHFHSETKPVAYKSLTESL